MTDWVVSSRRHRTSYHTQGDCRHLSGDHIVREATDAEREELDHCQRCAGEVDYPDRHSRLWLSLWALPPEVVGDE